MKFLLLAGVCFFCISGAAWADSGIRSTDTYGESYPDLTPNTINPLVIGESIHAEGGVQIVEREYQLSDGGSYLYVKRKYELLDGGELKLIWRSEASMALDKALCEKQGLLAPQMDAVTIVSADAQYPVICAASTE